MARIDAQNVAVKSACYHQIARFVEAHGSLQVGIVHWSGDHDCGSTAKLSGLSPRWWRCHIVAKAASKCRVKRFVSNKGQLARLLASLDFSRESIAGSRASAVAAASYST